MRSKILNTFIFLLVINLTAGYAQDITCKGIITDAKTNLPLQDVRICSGATEWLCLNGEFQLSPLKADYKLILKKSGYAWHVLRLKNNDLQQGKLVPSNPENSEIKFVNSDNKRIEDEVDFYFDGQLVPKTEWADALSMDPKEIGNLEITLNRDGKPKLYIYTK